MIRWFQDWFHRSMDRRAAALARRLAPHIPPGASLLDVGSGTGHNAHALRCATGGTCLETDVVDFHVVGPGPVLFDGSRLPMGDGAVDVCLLAFVLNYANNPVALLRDAGRVASRRVLLVQSTCQGRWSRTALELRNWFQGPFAFRVCRGLGLIPSARFPAQPQRLVGREHLAAIVAEAGLILRRVEPEPGFAAISRDLMVLDRPGVSVSSPDPDPHPPSISVIIPARNEAALIAATVESVLRARDVYQASCDPVPPVELLIIDNASTDGTAGVLTRLAAQHADLKVATCRPLGAASARNLGAHRARGQILVFLDADTQLPPEGLRRFADHCGSGRFEAGITRLGALDGGWRAWCWWTFWNQVRRLPLAHAKAMPACMFCTRATFDRFGPFDVRVAIGEEWPILAVQARQDRHRLIYDRTLVARSSSRRMELQRFGYCRTFARYVWAILSVRGRVGYPDHIRHAPGPEVASPPRERDSHPAPR